LLNHIPVIGELIAFGLFLFSFLGKKNEDLRRTSYILFATIALFTIPTFETGFAAQGMVKGPGVEDLIRRHESSALLSVWFMLITGSLALVGLWKAQSSSRPPRWNVIAVLIFSLLSVVLISRTSNTGGDIRHPELRPPNTLTVTEGTFGSIVNKFEPDPDKFSAVVTFSKWWWTGMMAAHFIGLIMIIGSVGLYDLRIMGFLKQLPVAPLHRLLPWGMLGLAINILTGLLAFASRPDGYIFSIALWLKMLGLMLLGLNAAAFYMTDIFEDVENLKAGDDAAITAKLVAASSLILWFVVIAMGRYIQPMVDTLLSTN
jgi:uncharacterized membrane protein